MIVVGLTGSIGMGKSTTAGMFAALGIPVLDSDQVVQEIYASEEAKRVNALFPGVLQNGTINRQELSRRLLQDPSGFARLEAVVHPLVHKRRKAFVKHHDRMGTPLIVLDIPLLFETKAEREVDMVVVVSAPQDIQVQRVLARPGMTRPKLEAILARQMPDAIKCERADFVVKTGSGLDEARHQVHALVDGILKDPTLWAQRRKPTDA